MFVLVFLSSQEYTDHMDDVGPVEASQFLPCTSLEVINGCFVTENN